MTTDPLAEVRARIDAVDVELQALLNRRAQYALDVASIKAQHDDASYYRPEREAQVLQTIRGRQKPDDPLSPEAMVALFREIVSSCRALETPVVVAFLGPAGTFTQEATYKHFGHAITARPVDSIAAVFRDIAAGDAAYGVVPVENSTEGAVTSTLDLLQTSKLRICGEVNIRVHQHLLGRKDTEGAIQTIVSHQQSFAQCQDWLARHYPQAEIVTVSSNARAAQMAMTQRGVAAIAGQAAADVYQLTVFARNIEDNPYNSTRFLIIGHTAPGPSGNDKTSLLMLASNTPGALHLMLQPFHQCHINMSRIESRPSRIAGWQYVFFIDIDGHVDDDAVKHALSAITRESGVYRVLGAYPKSVLA